MAKKPGVSKNLTQLKVIQSALKKMVDNHYIVQVGIFGDKDARPQTKGDVTNAEIGFIHEMGSVSMKIPQRSFLLDTFAHHGKDLMKDLKKDVETLFKKGKVDEYLKEVGIAATNLVHEAFQTSGWGSWPPNAYSTLLRKVRGSLGRRRQMAAEVMYEGADHAKPLIKSGQLWRSISSRTVRG